MKRLVRAALLFTFAACATTSSSTGGSIARRQDPREDR